MYFLLKYTMEDGFVKGDNTNLPIIKNNTNDDTVTIQLINAFVYKANWHQYVFEYVKFKCIFMLLIGWIKMLFFVV